MGLPAALPDHAVQRAGSMEVRAAMCLARVAHVVGKAMRAATVSAVTEAVGNAAEVVARYVVGERAAADAAKVGAEGAATAARAVATPHGSRNRCNLSPKCTSCMKRRPLRRHTQRLL